MLCSVRHCLVFVGALLVGCGVRELEPSTDVILGGIMSIMLGSALSVQRAWRHLPVVAPNLDRDALSHPGCLQSLCGGARMASRVHMHGSNYMAQGQMQPCIAQRTPTWRPDCLPGSAGGQGILSCSATKTPTALARPACRPMGGGGRNIPIKRRAHGGSEAYYLEHSPFFHL